MAAAYERQWGNVGPKITRPLTLITDVVKPITEPAKAESPVVAPKTPRPFIPALPSNPRPRRRPSEDIRNPPQDLQTSPINRAASTIAKPLPDIHPAVSRSKSTSSFTKPQNVQHYSSRSLSSDSVAEQQDRQTSPLRSRADSNATKPQDPQTSPLRSRLNSNASMPQDSQILPSRSRANSTTTRTEPVRRPSTLKSPKATRKPSISSPTNVPLKISSPRTEEDSEVLLPETPREISISIPKRQNSQDTESAIQLPQGAKTPSTPFQQAMYLRIIDIPPSQRSSDTMPVGYTPETPTTGNILSASPIEITPAVLLESLGADAVSPPSSGDESDPKTPLTPLVEARQSLQPAPLHLKTQNPPDPVVVESSPLTPTSKTLPPPPEADLPPISEPNSEEPTRQTHKRNVSVKFKDQPESEAPRRRPSNASPLGPLAPRSLTAHLLALSNTPRKLYLATHSPFLRTVSTCKATPALIATYLFQERLYLHSTLRLLSLLLANIILPTKPSGLISKRRGGVRDKMREEAEKAERKRKEKAQKGQKDFGPGMGANIGVEAASGAANLGIGMVLGGVSGIATGVGMKTATGAGGVGLSNLGNSSADQSPEEERVIEVVENMHKDIGERAVDFLVAAIGRTRRMMDLFEEVSEDISGIHLDGEEMENGEGGEMSALTMFTRLFGEIGGAVEKRERSVLAGLVMLYAREKAHLDSWVEISTTLSSRPHIRPNSISLSQKRKSEPDRGAVRIYLLPAFTSEESVSYLEDLGKLVDDLWSDKYLKRDMDSRFIERSEKKMRRGGWEEDVGSFEKLWEMVLDIQGRFWPVV